ncbi:HD-GYP domain-containing protein [Gottfriedia sp. NPDC056225]|uniref:HD-GYP domain-containing protein n=1 Tax=Gottfriedia sp. NPDC056225 TaxID=3345751 RepID=UPI00155A03C9|nr:HD domain-containing protein [Arthrobacter citreus]
MIKKRPNLVTNELIDLLNKLDYETFMHGMRVGEMLYRFSSHLNLTLPQSNQLHFIGYVHDIGKLQIPNEIVQKQGPLTDNEWDLMRNHTTYGYDILKNLLDHHKVLNAVRYHHENINGTGYEGLCGDEIDFNSRVVRIIDSFDALTHDRPYKKSCSIESSLKKIQRLNGTVYDRDLVNEFTKFICS